ncbi:MAG: hypothetical protein ACI86H_001818 [bacterium]|jgi:hypothetical protein
MNKDLTNPKTREKILSEDTKRHHSLLRQIFKLEMDYRFNYKLSTRIS